MQPDFHILKRNLFSASHIYTKTTTKGATIPQMTQNMPTVIMINILDYIIRDSNTDVLQPFKILYTKEPAETAVSNFYGYNIQLPRLKETEPDFNDGLYCWLYTLYTAKNEGKPIGEVIRMTPPLQEYAQHDAGYQQFCEQYERVSSDQKTRDEYHWWLNAQMSLDGQMQFKFNEGKMEGKQEERRTIINKLLHSGMDAQIILTSLGITESEWKELQSNK
jgi:hypothetical protein